MIRFSPFCVIHITEGLHSVLSFFPQRRQKADEKDKDLRSSKDMGADEPATMMNQEKEESTEVSRVVPPTTPV